MEETKRNKEGCKEMEGCQVLVSGKCQYIIRKTIGKGGSSIVLHGTDSKGNQRAIKQMDNEKVNKKTIYNEVEALSKLNHKGIVKMHNFFMDGHWSYVVMEYVSGVDLFSYLEARHFAPVPEKTTKIILKQLIRAMIYSHRQGIAHRDLKLENILYDETTKKTKIIDFGLCDFVKEGKPSCSFVGTSDYMPPEVLARRPYSGLLADVFCLGTILYTMLFAEFPFDRNARAAFQSYPEDAHHPELTFPKKNVIVSNLAKELMIGMLALNPQNRLTMKQVANHKFFSRFSFTL